LKIPIVLMDERLTSRRADAVTIGAGAATRSRDELAAMFLLQDYFDRLRANVT
jgi:RNase H-fold protein (predicted Holliday junction resolvase)